MARMSDNYKGPSGIFGDILQLTNWILDSGATFHLTPEVPDFIPGLLEDVDKHIKVADRHNIKAKQKGQVQKQMCNNNRDAFIATLHNVILAPDLCNELFFIVTLINS